MCQTVDEGIGQALGYFSTIMVKSLAVYIDHRLLKSITCGHHVGQVRCEVGSKIRIDLFPGNLKAFIVK